MFVEINLLLDWLNFTYKSTKNRYPPRYYKFGYEKITNPDDPYDAE